MSLVCVCIELLFFIDTSGFPEFFVKALDI